MSQAVKELVYALAVYVVLVGGWWLWQAVK
jgi:hypothetical protein